MKWEKQAGPECAGPVGQGSACTCSGGGEEATKRVLNRRPL